jgi:hypothetical protein
MKRSAILAIVLGCLLLAACAPTGLTSADQVATFVAATLAANGQPVPTAEPTLGEVATQVPTACANSDLVSVAYIKDQNVWLWLQGGMRTQLTNSGDAVHLAISDDGCRIAYSRAVPNPIYDASAEFPMPETLNELWAVNSDGSNNHVLVDTAYLSALPADVGYILSVFDLDFQPGSHSLAFNTQVLHPGVGLTVNQDLFTVEVDSGVITPLLSAGQAGGTFAFSPDGAQIAMSSATNVHVINSDGSDFRPNLITFDMVSTYSEYAYTPPLHWTPDGASLMVAVPPADPLAPPAAGVFPETALWWIPLDGTPAFEAGAVQSAFFVLDEVNFSPDAGRIAYLRPLGDEMAETHELVIALSDGSNELPPIAGPILGFVAWSADSSRYVYSYNDGALHLMLGNVNDSNVQPISTLNAFSAFSADGEWVDADRFVLHEMGDAGAQLSLMNVSGAGEIIDTFNFQVVQFDITH